MVEFLCATAIRKIPVSKLAETVADGKTAYVGELTESDLAVILEISPLDIMIVQKKLNSRPRKKLDYSTPNSEFQILYVISHLLV